MTAPLGRIEHGGALTAACGRYGGKAEDWLDLSTGINPVPAELPPLHASVWQRLPDDHLFDRASAAAARCYRAPDGTRPLPVAGVQAAIQMLPNLFEGPVAILGPTYGEYRHCFERAGRSVDEVPDLTGVDDHHRVVIVVNPNNPDGRVIERNALLALAGDLEKRGGCLIVDEAFADLQPDISLGGVAGNRSGLVVLRSFGKYFGLAGMRLGFVLAENRVIEALRRLQGPWAVSGPALAIADEVMRDDAAIAAVGATIRQRRQALETVLTGAGLLIAGGTDLFVLVDHEHAPKLHEGLCQNQILTRRFDFAPRWLRFGLCPDSESDQRLARVLSEHG